MLVNVTDDDTAGVVVTTTHINTTIDNYGDALDEGAYGIRLTSEPRHDVTVDLSLSGDSRFSYTDVSSVTFTADNWNVRLFPPPVGINARTSLPLFVAFIISR